MTEQDGTLLNLVNGSGETMSTIEVAVGAPGSNPTSPPCPFSTSCGTP